MAEDATTSQSSPAQRGGQGPERKGADMISELPLDILREIFSQLHPTAVLRLAQTCKAFRKYLMNRTLARASVWIPALESVDYLPQCPENMSEPKYTYFIFYTRCDDCQTIDPEKSVIHIYVTGQMLCVDCIPKHFAKIDDIPNVSDENIGELVSEWTVPWVSIPGGERVYHKESARELIEDYKSLPPDDADAVYDLQSGWEEWKKSWVVFRAQCEDFVERRGKVYRRLKKERQKQIIKRMSGLGFSKECATFFADTDCMSCDRHNRRKELEGMWKRGVENERLTDREWEQLESIVAPFMEEERAYQLELVREDKMADRLYAWFKPAFLRFIFSQPANAGLATAAELALMPEWRKAFLSKPVEEDLSADDIAEAVAQMPSSCEKIRRWKTEQLVDAVRRSKTYEGKDVSESVLLLASTIFRCARCQESYTYTTAIIHECNYTSYRLGVDSSGAETVFEESPGSQTLTLRGATGPERRIFKFFKPYNNRSDIWDVDKEVVFDNAAHEHVVHMLDVLGRDRSTLANELERDQPYVQVLCPCYGEKDSRKDKSRQEVVPSRRAMKWIDAINHARPHLESETPHPWYAKLEDQDQEAVAKFEGGRHKSIRIPPLWAMRVLYFSSDRYAYPWILRHRRLEHPEGIDATKAYVDSLPSFPSPGGGITVCVVALPDTATEDGGPKAESDPSQ